MASSVCGNVEVLHLDGPVAITRAELAAPRTVSAAEADDLFRERVIEFECSCTTPTPDPS